MGLSPSGTLLSAALFGSLMALLETAIAIVLVVLLDRRNAV